MRLMITMLGAVACLAGSAAEAKAASDPVVLASYPAPAFLENLTLASDGAVLFTSYLGKTIERIGPDDAVTRFATLDVHPVSILPYRDGFLVAAHRIEFTAGPSFLGSGELIMLDAEGKATSRVALPQAGFANGMLMLVDGSVLIADSGAGAILRFYPASGKIETFFQDTRLAPSAPPAFLPGANGLKRMGDRLIISSSAAKTLFSLPLSATGVPAGPMTVLAEGLAGADDFVVLPEGGLIVATHGTSVVRIMADGSRTTLIDDPRLAGNTALAVRGSGADRALLILGTGGLAEGRNEPGVVMAVPLPEA